MPDILKIIKPSNTKVSEFYSDIFNLGHTHSEFFIKTLKKEIWADISGHMIKNENGEKQAILLINTDISERKRLEEEIEKHQKHLEDLVQERTAELLQVNKKLEEQLNQRIKYTRVLVHELKTPLTPLLVASELLKDSVKDESLEEMSEVVYEGASALSKRIDELLDIARGEIGILKFDSEPCKILDIIKDVCQYMAYLFKSKKQSFTVEIPDYIPDISINAERIRQVLTNLLDNSSKYTQNGGQIILRVIDNSDEVIIEVKVDGLSIPVEKRDELFTFYGTLANEEFPNAGIGLGLALSKIIIELHGGRIWCKDNESGVGVVFGFSLPFRRMKK